jgi:Fur family transcriptional regulator, ferric uptake regulator
MKKTNESLARYRKILQQKGLRFTKERAIILEEINQLKSHFDADKLYHLLNEKGHSVSLDTVYRNIPLILQAGLVQKSVGEGKKEYFERTGVKGHHDHMVCIECGKVIEFHSEKIERGQDEACKAHNFELVFHDHRLFGYCSSCKRTRK